MNLVMQNLLTTTYEENILQQDKLVEDISKTIENEILTFSEEQIDDIFNGINKSTTDSNEYGELYVLEKLQARFKDKTDYYYARKHKKYDCDAIKYSIAMLIITVVLVYLLYILIPYYGSPIRKLIEIIRKFKEYGENITQFSERYTKAICYYLQVIANENLSSSQLLIINRLGTTVVNVCATIYSWIGQIMSFFFICLVGGFYKFILKYMIALFCWVIVFIVVSIIFVFENICGWLWPNYKQRYERWSIIEEKIEKRISFLNRSILLKT